LVVIRGDMHSIRGSASSSIQDGSVFTITHAGPSTRVAGPLNIGDDVTIAHNVTLHGCRAGNRVLIGSIVSGTAR
jgi:carbonic anhydrase/acetyltransferase-like protein (isoleucine patch superfamily)